MADENTSVQFSRDWACRFIAGASWSTATKREARRTLTSELGLNVRPAGLPAPAGVKICSFPNQVDDWRKPVRLQKVVHRKPVPFLLHPEREDRAYLGVYCVETLECGHKVATYPQADALIAVRRDCKDCGSNVIEFPVAKSRKKAA